MVFKDTRAKVEKTWTTTKKVLAMMSVWGLIFSLVTISRLGVAFVYDDALVSSWEAFDKAGRAAQVSRSPEYWSIVNNSYELESPRLLPFALACAARVFGFRVAIFAERPAAGGEALRKDWRRLSPRSFTFVPDGALAPHLVDGRYVLFFGSSDQDILQARKAGVYAVRIKRGRKSVGGGEYSPRRLGELVLPLSEF